MKKKIKSTRWKLVDNMFRSLLFTGAVIEFSQVGAAFIDGIIISRFLGPEAMAGEGIAYPIFPIIGVVSGMIATGMQVTCSQLIGRGKVKDINQFFSASVILGAIMSLLIAIPTLIFAKPFAVLLGASGTAKSIVAPASQYLFGIGVGIPPLIMVAILTPAIQIDSGRKQIQRGAVICSIADIVFDLLAVYLKLGILGIGLATAFAYYINFAYICLHFRKKDRMLHFVKPKLKAKEFFGMLSNGTEKATRRLINVIRPMVLNTLIISYGGAMAMSALSIRNNLDGLAGVMGTGITSAVSLLTGLFYGEVNKEAISEVKSYQWKSTAVIYSVVCAFFVVFSKMIAKIYVPESGELLDMVNFAIIILGLQTGLNTLVMARINYLQAIIKKVNMNVFIFISNLVMIVLSAFILGKFFGVYGILSSFLVSDLMSLAAIYIFYQIKCRKFFIGKSNLLSLPDYFELHPGDVISLDIRDIDDVAFTSEQIQLFCKGHKYESRIAYQSSLTFEEIASNIIRYGFPMNKKKDPIIDLRVVALEDSLIMRIRDDCPHFDITKRIAEINEDDSDPVSNLGIRITSKTAKNITYTHAFDTNNITITYENNKS